MELAASAIAAPYARDDVLHASATVLHATPGSPRLAGEESLGLSHARTRVPQKAGVRTPVASPKTKEA